MNKRKDKPQSKILSATIFIARLLFASMITFLLASAIHTQSVLSNLVAVGADIPLMLRIETIFVDWLGLLPTYGLIILIGMLIAMSVTRVITGFLNKKTKHYGASRKLRIISICLYTLAGALAIFCILIAMHPILNVTIIAGARGLEGILSQSAAGAFGGAVFALTYQLTMTKKGS